MLNLIGRQSNDFKFNTTTVPVDTNSGIQTSLTFCPSSPKKYFVNLVVPQYYEHLPSQILVSNLAWLPANITCGQVSIINGSFL